MTSHIVTAQSATAWMVTTGTDRIVVMYFICREHTLQIIQINALSLDLSCHYFHWSLAEMCVMIIRIHRAARNQIHYVLETPPIYNMHMLQIVTIYRDVTGCHIHALRMISGL